MRSLLRRLYLSVTQKHRVAVLDYPIEPKSLYPLQAPHLQLLQYIAGNSIQYENLLEEVLKRSAQLVTIRNTADEKDPVQPSWNNGYLPGLDMVLLYTIIDLYKPSAYVEIGSGNSTKIAARVRKDNMLSYSITSIDPFPRQAIRNIADVWHMKPVQKISNDIFKDLKAGDVLFFDGTHTLLPNSDVTWFFMEVLPALSPGVIVHVHDIYLPYDYPQFMLDRYYSENYILGAVLLANPSKYEVMAPAFYMSEQEQMAGRLQDFWKHPNLAGVEKHGGSFWFRVLK
jgi:predicted O-methyltransferase YrrM